MDKYNVKRGVLVQKETVLAKLHGKIDFSAKGVSWLDQYPNEWWARNEGDDFLNKFSRTFESTFHEICSKIIKQYFFKFGLEGKYLPNVKILETYRGSIIIEAVIAIAASMGGAFAILKGVLELPKIADGLEDLKKRIKNDFQKKVEEEGQRLLLDHQDKRNSKIPENLFSTDFSIDARPIRSLQADKGKDHKIHLSVSISRSVFVLENLGTLDMRNIRIGIFSSSSEMHQWSFAKSYGGAVTLLSSGQSISKDVSDFKNSNGSSLDLSRAIPLYVDCWIQDDTGIHIFNFYLE